MKTIKSKITKDDSGFTLLELLIVVVVLVFIGIGISEIIWNTYRIRGKLLVEGDYYNTIRLSVGILEKDISLIYSPQMILPVKPVPLTQEDSENLQNLLRAPIDRATDYFGGFLSKEGVRPSRFVGEEQKITFLSAAHTRIYKGVPESIFAQTAYELRDEAFQTEELENTKVLTKIENTDAFDTEDRDRKEFIRHYPILPGVTKLKFRYYRKERDQWFEKWDTDRPETKNIFPDVIEMQLEVKGPRELIYEGRYLFKPEIPIYGIHPST